jgi:hypothetical protein
MSNCHRVFPYFGENYNFFLGFVGFNANSVISSIGIRSRSQ